MIFEGGNWLEQLTYPQIQAMLNSTEGQQLLQLLQNQSEAVLAQARGAAMAGNFDAVKNILKPIIEQSNAADLAKSLGKKLG